MEFGISSLFVFFGAAIFVAMKFFASQMFKGWMGLIIQAGLGLGLAFAASFVSNWCPALGTILVAAAIVLGGVVGILSLMFGSNIPWIGAAIAEAVSPIEGVLMILLALAVLEIILNIVSILEIIPGLGTVLFVIHIALPIIQLAVMWAAFSGAWADLPDCIFTEGGRTGAIPGTGGIHIGT